MIIKATVKNFRCIKGLHEFNTEGKSFMLVADSGGGKSSLLQVIAASCMLDDYPVNPLSDGETEGFSEVVRAIDGAKYTIRRDFKRVEDGTIKLSRFSVSSSDGSRYSSLTDFLTKRLNGTVKNFEYAKYFFECKSPEARFRYMIDAIGGEEVYKNNAKISDLEKERAAVGSQRTAHRIIFEQEGIFNADTVDRDLEYYKNQKSTDAAVAKKNQKLAKRKFSSELSTRLNELAALNGEYTKEHNNLSELNMRKASLESQLAEAEELCRQLRKKIEDVGVSAVACAEKISSIKYDQKEEFELRKQLLTIEEDNRLIEEEANREYEEEVSMVTLFNSKRDNFNSTIIAYREWERLDREWNEIDEKIKYVRMQSKGVLTDKLNIPELSIGEVGGKDTILWNGRELSFENMSKGESIQVTAKIQAAINPSGDNFIIIPEAQSLGSKLAEIITECEKLSMQACIEYTKSDEDLRIEIVEES